MGEGWGESDEESRFLPTALASLSFVRGSLVIDISQSCHSFVTHCVYRSLALHEEGGGVSWQGNDKLRLSKRLTLAQRALPVKLKEEGEHGHAEDWFYYS